MTASRFDRLRPRTEPSDPAPTLDNEGKRALFSSSDVSRQGSAIVIDCSRCAQVTTLTPTAALRAIFPALHLFIALGRGDRQTSIGLLRRRRYGSWLRCPACGHGAWARVTVRV